MRRINKYSWLWLMREIRRKVPRAQLNEPVIFLERYDEPAVIEQLDVVKATEDITDGSGEVVVPKGHHMLR
jgi:hypothetical protein